MKYWLGQPSDDCEMCNKPLKDVFVDGRTKSGQWGFLCLKCHKKHGVGLGVGCGQQYRKQTNGKWLKVGG